MRLRVDTVPPYRRARSEPDGIRQPVSGKLLTPRRLIAIGIIGQHYTPRITCCQGRLDLAHRRRRFGLKTRRFGKPDLRTVRGIVGPLAWQVQAIAHRQATLRRRNRADARRTHVRLLCTRRRVAARPAVLNCAT